MEGFIEGIGEYIANLAFLNGFFFVFQFYYFMKKRDSIDEGFDDPKTSHLTRSQFFASLISFPEH
jgi:hypothetical protein